MKKVNKTIREFGNVWRQSDFEYTTVQESFDQIYLSDADFSHLLHFIEENKDTSIDQIFQVGRKKGKPYIKVKNYVGIIETRNGSSLEILPKIYGLSIAGDKEQATSRNIFLRMLRCLKDTPFVSIKNAHLRTKSFPILEVFITVFLAEIQQLFKVGLKQEYQLIEGQQNFLKGKLLIQEQQRRNALRPHQFYVAYDELRFNNPSNRLIKSCLRLLLSASSSIANQNKIRHYLAKFDPIPFSNNHILDLQKAKQDNRLHLHYKKPLAWSKIFLNGQSFTNFKGKSLNHALLFPMEHIFENYVGIQIKKHLPDYKVQLQDKRFHLINEHLGKPKFRLRPDIVLSKEETMIIIDTKWKIINENRPRANYKITQSDLYQLFGYGEKYEQSGKSPILILLYPMQENFTKPLPVFHYYSARLPLYVLPFNLANDNIGNEIKNITEAYLRNT